jgi:hypothetical protein
MPIPPLLSLTRCGPKAKGRHSGELREGAKDGGRGKFVPPASGCRRPGNLSPFLGRILRFEALPPHKHKQLAQSKQRGKGDWEGPNKERKDCVNAVNVTF